MVYFTVNPWMDPVNLQYIYMSSLFQQEKRTEKKNNQAKNVQINFVSSIKRFFVLYFNLYICLVYFCVCVWTWEIFTFRISFGYFNFQKGHEKSRHLLLLKMYQFKQKRNTNFKRFLMANFRATVNHKGWGVWIYE